MNGNTNHEDTPEVEPQQSGSNSTTPVVIPPSRPGPTFNTPLIIRLFLVAAAIFLFKMVYDISEQTAANQQAITQLDKKIDDSRMGKEIGKSSTNIQIIQNDVHEEMTTIRKKVNDISNRLTTVQQDLRDPFRR